MKLPALCAPLALAVVLTLGQQAFARAAEAEPHAAPHAAEEKGSGGEPHGEDAEGGEHDSHASSGPLSFQKDLAIWTAVVFLLLLAVLRKFAWGPISAGLDKREENVAANIRAAEQSNEEARRLLAEYEKKLAAAQDQVRAILDEARRDAEHTQQEILAKARRDAQAEMERGKREIEIATEGALKSLSEHMANEAVSLAGKLVRKELTPADHAALIDEAVGKFPSLDPSKN